MDSDKTSYTDLPKSAIEYIDAVIKKMRYRKKVRADVRAELTAHFQDALRDCDTEEKKTKLTADLIAKFGEPKILAKLIRRGKKRCRPLWQRAIVGCLQLLAVSVVLFSLYTIWFVTGKPVIETDYLALINQMQRDIKPRLSDDNNALYDYEKAEQLYVEPTEEEKELIDYQRGLVDRVMTNTEKDTVRQWLKVNEPAWQHLVAGTEKPYYYYTVEHEDGSTEKSLVELAVPIPEFWRPLRIIGFWRMKMAIDQGQTREAVEICLTIIKIAPQLAKNSYWTIEHMMAALSVTETLNYILPLIDKSELSAVELKKFQEKLVGLFPDGYPLFILPLEEMHITAGLDSFQRMFTSVGPGGGHIIPDSLDGHTEFKTWPGILKGPGYAIQGMLLAGRDDSIALVNQIHKYSLQEIVMTPYQFRSNESSTRKLVKEISKQKKYKLFNIGETPIMRGRAVDIFQTKAYYEAAITILALERWKLDKGRYPSCLDELVEGGYISSVPMDPYSDGPLIYKPIEDNFTLYSVGPDFDDDSGQLGQGSDGKRSSLNKWNFEDGDAVFWPVYKDEN